eukprot:TRINITY_DN37908_c0_g1_i1.p1 TRINITY_DN37908_c0_g1~~TRINITY_DN37908_c0_g1_i1.p1  ORF type:complete len:416 (+),score=66.78 TRINITY_DN37908_c0_g1_i1:318-1565(+)
MDNTPENGLQNLELDFDQELCQETQVQVKESENEASAEMYQPNKDICNLIYEFPSESERVDECQKVENLEDDLQDQNVLGKSNKEISDCNGQYVETFETPISVQSDVIKSGSCFKLLFILSSTTIWLTFLVYCYLYLTTVCVPVELWCPNPTHTFTAQACCSSLWLNLGSTIGLGNECSIEMADMEAGCPMYDCYKNDSTAELNVNGCSYVPNTLFNEAACNIHDLCYITPGSTKKACDDTFVENIILIYCDNVNVFERIACRGRAQLAGAVVSAIDSFYNDSEELRATCNQTSNSLAIFTGMLASLIISLLSACFIHTIVKRFRTKEILQSEDEVDDTFEYQCEQISETNETACYCDEPMENCKICDEVFIKEMSLECDINEVLAQEEANSEESSSPKIERNIDSDLIEKEESN